MTDQTAAIPQGPSVSNLLVATFSLAEAKNPGLAKIWVGVSIRLGGMLPKSLLTLSVQQDGYLDILLRAMEDERAAGPEHEGIFEFNYQKMFSELWVGRFYEHLRLLTSPDRKQLLPRSGDIGALLEDFELLRITIEKHEIAKDQKLAAPLKFEATLGNKTNLYEYDRLDQRRAHIMPSGLSPRGSVAWQVVDLKHDQERWIERRSLSERIVQLWGHNVPAPAP